MCEWGIVAEVQRHEPSCAAVKRERALEHPPEPKRDQVLKASRVLLLEMCDGVTIRDVACCERFAWRLLPHRFAHFELARARGGSDAPVQVLGRGKGFGGRHAPSVLPTTGSWDGATGAGLLRGNLFDRSGRVRLHRVGPMFARNNDCGTVFANTLLTSISSCGP